MYKVNNDFNITLPYYLVSCVVQFCVSIDEYHNGSPILLYFCDVKNIMCNYYSL